MGKRSNFERLDRDFYPTPMSAVLPVLPFLPSSTRFVEPCAGNGILIDHLTSHGHICVSAYDIEPQRSDINKMDALTHVVGDADYIITNPPWDRKILHPLIEHFSNQKPTWLLFDADWMHTKQSSVFMDRCKMIVSVGRVKWIPDSKMQGKDNCAWYLFDNTQTHYQQTTFFIGR